MPGVGPVRGGSGLIATGAIIAIGAQDAIGK
jgi:hypothetical protein